MAKTIGYAVVGLGHIAQESVLPAFAGAQKNSRLVALVSSDQEKLKDLAKQYEVQKTFSYEEYDQCLADEEVDAVYIALPNTMHAEYTERAAAAGVHVLCEKPMATSEEECQRMIRACREASVKLMIAYRLHFERANLSAIDIIKSGQIGEPKFFLSTFSYQVRENNIRTDKKMGGGPLWDIGIYCINATRYLFQSEPTEVFAQAARSQDPRFAEVEEGASVSLKFPNQRLASFICSFDAAPTSSYRVVGTQGELRLDNAYEYRGQIQRTLTVGEKTERKKFPERDQFAPELLYFSNCVLKGREPEPSGTEGWADVRILEAVYQSIRENKPVSIEPVPNVRHPQPEQEIDVSKEGEGPLIHVEAPHAG